MSNIGINLFDVGDTVERLMAKQYIPYFQLQTAKSAEQIQITAYGSLASAFSNFQSQMQNVTNAFNTVFYQAVSSNSSVVSSAAVTNNDVGTGTHTVNVTQLAQAQQFTSQAVFSSSNSGLGISETLTFTNNSNPASRFSVTVNASNTLENIRDNINNASTNTGVTAAIITSTGSGGAAQYNLILTSNEGTANQITISGDTGNNFNFSQTATAKDAMFTFDGFNEVRSSNTITDVLDGLNFSLSGTGTAAITISQDSNVNMNTTIQTAITNMLAGYNQIMTFLDGNQYVTARDDKTRQFTTVFNSSFGLIKSQLQAAVNTIFNGSGDVHSLLDAGIVLSPSTQVTDQYDRERVVTSTGSMMIDQTPHTQFNGNTTLTNAITNDFNALKDYFTNPTSGFIATVNKSINTNIITTTGTGLLDAATAASETNESSTEQRIMNEKNRLDMVKGQLIDQFSRLNGIISHYQNLSNALEKQYAYLDNLIRGK